MGETAVRRALNGNDTLCGVRLVSRRRKTCELSLRGATGASSYRTEDYVARFLRDPEDTFTDGRGRSLRAFRILALIASFAAAVGLAGAGVALNGDPRA